MISFIKYFFILILLAAGALAGAYFYVEGKLVSIDNSLLKAGNEIYTVAPGATPQSVVEDLVSEREDRIYYRLWFKLHPEFSSLKAGTYSLEKAHSLSEALAIICEGKELAFYFPVIEGTRYEQVVERLKRDPNVSYDLDDFDLSKVFLLNPANPEGLLFAESYRYTVGDRASDIIRRSYTDLEKYLNQAWDQRASDIPLKNVYEALILASIVEKETAKHTEYPLVAAVFSNRLKNHMKLQSDPTTIYGIKERYDGNITRKDLQDVNEYNTYVIDGLPPTPIAVASKSAIEAVLHPADVDYLYFVADGTGGHKFSRTLAEHNRAVASYVKLQRERRRQSGQAARETSDPGQTAGQGMSRRSGVVNESDDNGSQSAVTGSEDTAAENDREMQTDTHGAASRIAGSGSRKAAGNKRKGRRHGRR